MFARISVSMNLCIFIKTFVSLMLFRNYADVYNLVTIEHSIFQLFKQPITIDKRSNLFTCRVPNSLSSFIFGTPVIYKRYKTWTVTHDRNLNSKYDISNFMSIKNIYKFSSTRLRRNKGVIFCLLSSTFLRRSQISNLNNT